MSRNAQWQHGTAKDGIRLSQPASPILTHDTILADVALLDVLKMLREQCRMPQHSLQMPMLRDHGLACLNFSDSK